VRVWAAAAWVASRLAAATSFVSTLIGLFFRFQRGKDVVLHIPDAYAGQ
jgi:hypothetical protein